MLEDTRPIFDTTERLAKAIDANWRSLALPEDLKTRFAALWNARIGYAAETAKGQMKLFTSPENAEYIADVALAKGMCAYALRRALHEYRQAAKDLATSGGVGDFEEEFKSKRDTPPPSMDQWRVAISNSNMSEEEKQRLELFLQDSGSFHGIKGIARDDFAGPALIKAIGHRIDRFGIADQIAFATNESLYADLISFVEEKTTPRDSSENGRDISRLLGEFEQAVVASGFRVATA